MDSTDIYRIFWRCDLCTDFDEPDEIRPDVDENRINFHQIIFGESPCDNCKYSKKCKSGHLACPDFVEYVETQKLCERDRIATRSMYIKLFYRDGENKISCDEELEIVSLDKIRGVNHKMIADIYYIFPSQVKKIIENHNG